MINLGLEKNPVSKREASKPVKAKKKNLEDNKV